ncbi:hypothetical protein B0H63DRAFT_96044 [Podospora didyma]|uniref:DHHA2 domain-containing protein n=1 Tax=Podospora didyma TaxID=330526 RepID=A0AAE0NX35_9PEZI|nr:hypothetical protein B0H63DRAFT_96044 [Podospora didyma]
MAPPPTARVSLKAFLATAKKALAAPPAQRPNPLTFVVGNESADLDSLCSALVLAYFRTHTPPHTLHIPLSNLPRGDLALRSELGAVLGPAGLKPEDLLTLSDLPLREHLKPEDTRWFLVDHNALTGDLAHRFADASSSSRSSNDNLVIGCIDHHDDEGAVPQNVAPRVFEKSGSCMSLVVDHFKDAWGKLEPSREVDAELAHVALGPILIDTTNLTAKNKTTDWDVRAVELVESRIMGAGVAAAGAGTTEPASSYDRTKFFDDVTHLKEDISRLSYRDIFRKDYKQWNDGDGSNGLTLGIAGVVQGLDFLVEESRGGKDKFLEALQDWAQEQKLDIAAVMTTSRPDGKFTRELLVWAFGEPAVKVVKSFANKNKDSLGLATWHNGALDKDDGGGAEWRAGWTQSRVEHSRKQVAPMLREAMKDSSKL